MNISSIIILISLSSFVISCGRSKPSGGGPKKVPISPEEMQFILAHQEIDCDTVSGGRCPEGIAKVFIISPVDRDDSHVCTGFLNGKNKLVTNNHCVEDAFDCANTYVSVYDGFGTVSARCKSIISTQDDGLALNDKVIDYTVMELDTDLSYIQSFKPASAIPDIGEELTAWVMDHYDGAFRSRITELACKAGNRVDSLQLSNCQVIQGNSGSPVLNSDNEIVGVIWGASLDNSVTASTPLSERRNLDEDAFVTELSHFKSYLTAE